MKSRVTKAEVDTAWTAGLDAFRGKVRRSHRVVLTTTATQLALCQLLMPELPFLAVLSYQERSPDMNIQPIDRLTQELPVPLSGGEEERTGP